MKKGRNKTLIRELNIDTNMPVLQQEMRACRPNFSTFPTTCLLIFSTIHLVLAIVVAFSSYGWKQMRIRYDNICSENATCNVQFEVTRQFQHPVHVYYELTSFYQTHFRFRNSIDYNQLHGEYVTSPDYCYTKTYNEQGELMAPCGLRAFYTWRDQYLFEPQWNVTLATTWEHEKGNLYKGLSTQYTDSQRWLKDVPGYENETLSDNFEIWMRTAAQPHFTKLYAIVNTNIDPGIHNVTIKKLYPESYYSRERYLVFIHQPVSGGRYSTLVGINSLICIIHIFTALVTSCLNTRMANDPYLFRRTFENLD